MLGEFYPLHVQISGNHEMNTNVSMKFHERTALFAQELIILLWWTNFKCAGEVFAYFKGFITHFLSHNQ